jgi:hypothetical protein
MTSLYLILPLALVAVLILTYLILSVLARNIYVKLATSFFEIFSTLALRNVAGTVKGNVAVNLYVIKSDQLYIDFGGVGLDYYVVLILSFLGILMMLGADLYARKKHS